MKWLLSSVLFFSATSAAAQTYTYEANLNLSQLYGGFDAGQYIVTLVIQTKNTPSPVAHQESWGLDDGARYCSASRSFDAGMISMELVSDGYRRSLQSPIQVVQLDSAEDQCPSLDELNSANRQYYLHFQLGGPLPLPAAPPTNYQSVHVYLTPFAGVIWSDLVTPLEPGKLIERPAGFVTKALQDPQSNRTLQYYVVAKDGSSTLSLGHGTVLLRPRLIK